MKRENNAKEEKLDVSKYNNSYFYVLMRTAFFVGCCWPKQVYIKIKINTSITGLTSTLQTNTILVIVIVTVHRNNIALGC